MSGAPLVSARGRQRLPRRVAALLGVGLLVPLLLVAALSLRALDAMGESVVADRQALAGALADRVEQALQRQLELLAALAAAERFDPEDADPGPERAALHAAWVRTRLLDSVSLLDGSGRTLLREPAAAAPPPSPPAPLAARPAVSGALETAAGRRVLVSVPLPDWRGRASVWAAGSLDPAAPGWQAMLRPRLLQPTLSVALRDAGGVELARQGPAPVPGPAVSVRSVLGFSGWSVTVSQPREAVLGPLLRFRGRLLWLAPLLFGLALVFAWGAARSVTQPLARLGAAADRIANGEIERPLPNLGQDEVGRLGAALEAMRRALRRAFELERRVTEELERRVLERTREIGDLNRKLRERDRARGRLLQRVISAQEEERERIARELHDETCQTLTALVLAVDAARDQAPLPAGLKALASRALDGIHELILALRPAVLDDLGLFAAIRWYADRQLATHGIAVRCEIEEGEARLSPESETAVFRVVQEALNNVARHAEADCVLIQIAPGAGLLRIEIEDDGKGFDPGAAAGLGPDGRGLGLLGMRERVCELLGGRLEIDATPGSGTRILIQVPTNPEPPPESLDTCSGASHDAPGATAVPSPDVGRDWVGRR